MIGDYANETFESIHAVMHLYRARQYRVLRDGPHDITHMEGKVLGFFAHHPQATQSDLAARSGRDKAQLARLVKGLRDKGLLEGQADEEDRRSVRLRLTEAGEAVHELLQAQARHLASLAVDGLSEEECRTLARLLGRIQENLGGALEPD